MVRFVSAGNNENFDFASAIGVGLVESAMNLSRLCLFDKPDLLVFVGSAGSYGKYGIFDIVEANAAANIELSFLEGRVYTPIDNVIKPENVLRQTTIVNSSNYITTDKESWEKMGNFGIGLENMEFFSVLRVAQEFEVPTFGIFVVTNYCDENAHADFLKNHREAKMRLEKYVKEKYAKYS